MKFEDYDLEQGFVLRWDEALKYLKWLASQKWDYALDKKNSIDTDSFGAEIDDLFCMAQVITDEDWEWVMISEHPMSASGVHIEQMKMANA